jgi:cation diffusion facilitator family transporter
MISVASKDLLYRLTRRVGLRFKDNSLLANAWHHRSDAFSSVAAAAGMLGVAIGGKEWAFLDHATALALSGMLVAIGLKLIAQAAQELIDRAPARSVMENIAGIVQSTAGVRSHHAFRMRQLGGRLEMDVHIQVDPNLTVCQGHDIATEVRRRIWEADPNVTNVIVHATMVTAMAASSSPCSPRGTIPTPGMSWWMAFPQMA